MGYYYRDSENVEHTDTNNSFKYAFEVYNSQVPFRPSIDGCNAKTIEMYYDIFKANEDYTHTYSTFDCENLSPTEMYKLYDRESLPFIGIKDCSTKIFGSLYHLAMNEFHPDTGPFTTRTYGYPMWLLNGLYISNYKQYYIDLYTLESNPAANDTPVYFPQRHTYIKWYELYNKNIPIVSYVDRSKGDILNFGLEYNISNRDYTDKAYYKSTNYWDSCWGPTDTNTELDRRIIRANNSHINQTGSIYNFNTNLSLANELDNVYKKINFDPLYESQNAKFNFNICTACQYFPEGTTASTPSGEYDFNYFRLDVSNIKQNFTKLKLKYYYTVLLDGKYSQITAGEASDGPVTNVTGHKIDKSYINIGRIHEKTRNSIFTFNYCFSNNELWPVYEIDSNDEPLFKLHENFETSMTTHQSDPDSNYFIDNTMANESFSIQEYGYHKTNKDNYYYAYDSFDIHQGDSHVFDNLYITKINDLAGETSLSSLGVMDNVTVLISAATTYNNWDSSILYSPGTMVKDDDNNWYIAKKNIVAGKKPSTNLDYWYKPPSQPHVITSAELWSKFGISNDITGNYPARYTDLKSYLQSHTNPFEIFYGTDNDNCFIERVSANGSYPDAYGSYYTRNDCFKYVNAFSSYFTPIDSVTAGIQEFDSTKKYDKGDNFAYNGTRYVSNVKIYKEGSRNIDQRLDIKGGAYNIYNATGYSHLKNYKSQNLIGSAEFIIDLTNVTDHYIHIAYPASILFNQDEFPEEYSHVYVTDLKMAYEGLE